MSASPCCGWVVEIGQGSSEVVKSMHIVRRKKFFKGWEDFERI